MDVREFGELVLGNLPFEPTDQQIQLVAALARFCSRSTPSDTVFILNGYAGTGKTSVMGSLVRSLRQVGVNTVLLASTGRAAKVLGMFTGFPAHTIHHKIYRAPVAGPDGRVYNRVADNPHVNTVFIIDEASMIGDQEDGAGSRSVLRDLVEYVYTGMNCRAIMVGDTAQLPPVGCAESPAMTPAVYKEMGMRATRATMTRVVRQKARSGILYNATVLRRDMVREPRPVPALRARGFADVEVVSPEDLQEAIEGSIALYGADQTLIVTRSNRRAVDFNLAARRVIFDMEEMLVPGERLMIAKNSYFWTRGTHGVDFLANGEMCVVERLYGIEKRAGGLFADVALYLPDHGLTMDVKLSLDALTSETAALPYDRLRATAEHTLALAGRSQASVTAQRDCLRQDPYYNALQVKYAYAVTCHKAQGGQWASVFIDMGYIPAEAYESLELYRWLYTAVTRATARVTLVNPDVYVE